LTITDVKVWQMLIQLQVFSDETSHV